MSDLLKCRPTPFGSVPGDGMWTTGRVVALDGASTAVPIAEDDVSEVLYDYTSDPDEWDGNAGALLRLKDGRLAAWETWWGPTGDGFSEDAYGGDSDLYFAPDTDAGLRLIIRAAFSDQTRREMGIPEELWA